MKGKEKRKKTIEQLERSEHTYTVISVLIMLISFIGGVGFEIYFIIVDNISFSLFFVLVALLLVTVTAEISKLICNKYDKKIANRKKEEIQKAKDYFYHEIVDDEQLYNMFQITE